MDEKLSFKGNDPGAAQFGNFINYYQFHPSETRINNLPTHLWNVPEELKEKRFLVLDIGCNSGELTSALHTFLIKNSNSKNISTLGIDIDPTLITRANEQNRENVTYQCMDIMTNEAVGKIDDYLKKHGTDKFDVIFCLSITMWIHLNHGDDGLKGFLNFLRRKSKLIVVEPQPWKCYRNAVRRMKKCSESFPLYETLKIRSNVEIEIENNIVCEGVFTKVCGDLLSSGWERKLLFFKLNMS